MIANLLFITCKQLINWIFAFLLMPFLVLFRFLLAVFFLFSVLSNFLPRFPRLALHLLLVALPLSFQPIFTQNPLSTNLNDVNFLRLKSFSFAGIVALRVD